MWFVTHGRALKGCTSLRAVCRVYPVLQLPPIPALRVSQLIPATPALIVSLRPHPRMQSYLSMSETETAVTSTFAPYRQHEVAIPLSRAATCLEEVGKEVYGPAKLWEGERMRSRNAGIQCGVPALHPLPRPARQSPAHALMPPSPILLSCRRPHPLPAALHHRRGLVPVPRTRRARHVHQL